MPRANRYFLPEENKETRLILDLAGMEMELSEMICMKVDLRTSAELSRYFRDDVLQKARLEYVRSQRKIVLVSEIWLCKCPGLFTWIK